VLFEKEPKSKFWLKSSLASFGAVFGVPLSASASLRPPVYKLRNIHKSTKTLKNQPKTLTKSTKTLKNQQKSSKHLKIIRNTQKSSKMRQKSSKMRQKHSKIIKNCQKILKNTQKSSKNTQKNEQQKDELDLRKWKRNVDTLLQLKSINYHGRKFLISATHAIWVPQQTRVYLVHDITRLVSFF